MRFDKFGITIIIVGLLILCGLMQFYYSWNWMQLLTTIILGGIVWFAIVLLVIGLLLIFI